jgi:hypothetical protein
MAGMPRRAYDVATPEPLDSVVENNWLESRGLWRKALADGHVSHAEAIAIYRYEQSAIAPNLTAMTVSWRVIGSITRGADGIYGYRVQRTCRELWARAANVVPFRRRSDGPEEAA